MNAERKERDEDKERKESLNPKCIPFTCMRPEGGTDQGGEGGREEEKMTDKGRMRKKRSIQTCILLLEVVHDHQQEVWQPSVDHTSYNKSWYHHTSISMFPNQFSQHIPLPISHTPTQHTPITIYLNPLSPAHNVTMFCTCWGSLLHPVVWLMSP